MLFDVPFIADWNKIGDYRRRQTDLSTERENKRHADYDYKISDRVLVIQDGILRKAQSTKPTRQRAMDYYNSSYEWNYQDSTRNQNGTDKYPESNTLY